jgi:hypothetical protein
VPNLLVRDQLFMRREILFGRDDTPRAPAGGWRLSIDQQRQVTELLLNVGLEIVRDARGPVPILTFGRRVLERLDPHSGNRLPLPQFADALKRVVLEMRHEKLRVMAPSDFLGVGYVYNAADPDTWPVRSSR